MTEFPASLRALQTCEPVYEEVDGWNEDISAVRAFDDLPTNTRKYIEHLQEILERKFMLVSVGAKRQAVFRRRLDVRRSGPGHVLSLRAHGIRQPAGTDGFLPGFMPQPGEGVFHILPEHEPGPVHRNRGLVAFRLRLQRIGTAGPLRQGTGQGIRGRPKDEGQRRQVFDLRSEP